MTDSDAIKTIKLDICNGCECIENCITNQCEYFLAIMALEKQEKIKEAFTHFAFSGNKLDVLNDCISALSEIKAILKE